LGIYYLRIRNKIAITFIAMFLGVICMIFTFIIYDIKEGPGRPTDFWGLVYIIGFIPSLILGGVYGLYLSFQIRGPKESEKTEI
jgi:hypothetical protein